MKKYLLFSMVMFSGLLFSSSSALGATTTSITQYGVTWTFDKAYQYGQFANGDYWVLGPVTITSITPAWDGTQHGWEVNPVTAGGQGFTTLVSNYDPSLRPSLPYTSPSSGIVSFVKTIGGTTELSSSQILTAVVLTIVTQTPPGNGATVFRPPYVGTSKPYYYVANLRTDLLSSYAPTGTPPSISTVASNFAMLRMDHKSAAVGRYLRPENAMNDYQPDNTIQVNEGALRLMLNDSIEAKMAALINYVQFGIDHAHTFLGMLPTPWPDGGGHQPGHILPIAFAATMLDITSVKSAMESAPDDAFHTTRFFEQTTDDGDVLWGQDNTETAYWNYIKGLGGSQSNADPYGFIDGGKCGVAYQYIVSQAYKGEYLAAKLMPSLQSAWPNNDFNIIQDYAPRWVNIGGWGQPDPCAPYTAEGTYQVDYGPDPANPGMCIKDKDLAYYNSRTDFACKSGYQCGRFPNCHGASRDGGQYRSVFVAAMWNAYSGTTLQTCSQLGGSCCSSGQICQGGSFQSSSNCGSLCCVGGTCQTPTQTCPDGTQYNQCSSTKPLYCSSGTLINNCQTCGCPAGQTCQASGACQAQTNCSSSTVAWSTSQIQPQNGLFTFQYDATPLTVDGDALVALSAASGTSYNDFAVLVRFNVSGYIDARNGGIYSSGTPLPYAANTQYHFRIPVNVAAKTYSVYVIPQGGQEVLLAQNFSFRSEQSNATQLSYWGHISEIGGQSVCNPIITSQQCHKSDSNSDGCVDSTELSAFISLWYLDSSNPTLKELIEAIGLWKRGCS